MRRRIAILLLILLPFQFAWSVAAAYCTHETGAAAMHFGHHFHVHKAAKDGKAAHAGQGVDSDCPACHVDGTSVPPDMPQVAATHSQPVFAPAAARTSSSAPPIPPDRPNWTSLA